MKWIGYPSSDNTWEPERNLECSEKIASYEEKLKGKAQKEEDINSEYLQYQQVKLCRNNNFIELLALDSSDDSPPAKKRKFKSPSAVKKRKVSIAPDAIEEPTSNYEEGAVAKRIIGARLADKGIMFLFEWQGLQEASLVPSEEANIKWPQVVIKFYEERTTWIDPTN